MVKLHRKQKLEGFLLF